MKKLAVVTFISILTATMIAGDVGAQKRGAVEVGIDLGYFYSSADEYKHYDCNFNELWENAHIIQIPAFGLRIGYFATNAFEIESSFGLQGIYGDIAVNEGTVLAWSIGLAYNYWRGEESIMPFIQAQSGLVRGPYCYSKSRAQYWAGGSAGLKIPLMRQLQLRLQAGASRFFEGDEISARTDVEVAVGFSFFLLGKYYD